MKRSSLLSFWTFFSGRGLIFAFLLLSCFSGHSFPISENENGRHVLLQNFQFEMSEALEFRVWAPMSEEISLEFENPDRPKETYKNIVLQQSFGKNGEFVYLLSSEAIEENFSNFVAKKPFQLKLKILSDKMPLRSLVIQKDYSEEKEVKPTG